ncbi:MAG: hypothetical protein Q8R82_08810, partial [Hyphomonadaceae bacterium]|nr:hypothetical protein [Hyphomonadaceae bacterium]
ACATEPRPQLAYGLSAGDVSNGFIMSVLEACVVAAERGVTLDQMGNYRILRDTIRSTVRPPKPGYSAWAPGLGQGVVEIEDGPGGCDVAAHGAAVEDTFDIIAGALRARGYTLETAEPSQPNVIKLELATKAVSGRSVRVVLTGNEPGAAGASSQFSALSAAITSTLP